MWLQLLKTMAALTGILGLIFGLAYVLKRYNLTGTRRNSGSDGWRILGVRALAPKKHVYILEVGTRVLVIGCTDHSMTTLMEITDSDERTKLLDALGKPQRTMSSFHDILRKAES